MNKIILTTQSELEELLDKTISRAVGQLPQKPEKNKDKIFPIKEASEFLDLAAMADDYLTKQ